jgi:tRNA(Ile)-lysidine synthase
MTPEPSLVDRFARDLDALARPTDRLGIAVSGGPDSLALLLLAAAARPGSIEAATVDHDLREGSREEAQAVAAVCAELGVPHSILTIDWRAKPETAIQERARAERYRLLAGWAADRQLDAIVTAHHADDQAETLVMRLNRAAGVRGLAGMRSASPIPLTRPSGERAPAALLRPLLTWRRADLDRICAVAQVTPVSDPSNRDARYERVRIRQALAAADWLDPAALAASAAHLASADEALDWAAHQQWQSDVTQDGEALLLTPADTPPEILRRLLERAIATLAHEGTGEPLRARELAPLLAALQSGGQSTLRGVLCTGGLQWRFSKAPERRG